MTMKEKECGFDIVWKWLREGADCLQEDLCYLCLKVLRHSSKNPTEDELTSMQNSFTEVRARNELKFWKNRTVEKNKENELPHKKRKEAEKAKVEAEKSKIAAEKAKEETRASASVPDCLGAFFAAPQPKAVSKFKNLTKKEVLKPKALHRARLLAMPSSLHYLGIEIVHDLIHLDAMIYQLVEERAKKGPITETNLLDILIPFMTDTPGSY